MIRLSALFNSAGTAPDAIEGQAEISSITADSRQVKPGALFVCMPGEGSRSYGFMKQAKLSGASAVLLHSVEGVGEARELGLPYALVQNQGLRFPEVLSRICRLFYQNPSRDMKVVGVTGTNGKTTTAWLMRDMLAALEVPAAYLGTLGFEMPGMHRDLANTTPFPVEIFGMLAEARDAGVQALSMEVSSHALVERRVDGIEFDAAVFTNLTQDHLDYHKTMEEYELAKLRLFSELGPRSGKGFTAALNVDDPVGRKWANQLGQCVLSFGGQEADLVGSATEIALEHMCLSLRYEGQEAAISVPLGGAFNVQNCLSASAGLLALGFSLDQVAQALPKVRPVPGRFEPVANQKGIGVIVDYAHTPDALIKLLDSVRDLGPNRVFTVFGCGGDRDRAKRPMMARAASERSDFVVLTSDNPRSEDPQDILKDVEKGLIVGSESVSIVDRQEAIRCSLKRAVPGDVVVIAGKGHENYQIIGKTKFHMDDREIAREALEA
jgi:UDP-N-acetylmuramoyl-L-alanyl-D-glutamate--2,6-diaminopimelate ligase